MTGSGLAFAATAALLAAQPARAQGCEVPLDAAFRLNETPYHMTIVTTEPSSGRSEVSEIISTDDATYVKAGDSWIPGPREALTLQESGLGAGDGMTCRLLRSDASRGTPTDVWQVEDNSDPEETRHQTVWIARETGLIVRLEIDVDVDGRPASTHASAEIEYENVLPPR